MSRFDVVATGHCPVCASPVVIHSSDEGTSSYEPVVVLSTRLLAKAMRAVEQMGALVRGDECDHFPPQEFYESYAKEVLNQYQLLSRETKEVT